MQHTSQPNPSQKANRMAALKKEFGEAESVAKEYSFGIGRMFVPYRRLLWLATILNQAAL